MTSGFYALASWFNRIPAVGGEIRVMFLETREDAPLSRLYLLAVLRDVLLAGRMSFPDVLAKLLTACLTLR
jgi:hypothetical protein